MKPIEVAVQANLVEERLAQEPIELPSSPFWEVFRDFGRDELIALIINAGGTILIAKITNNPLLLSISGPLVEKVGFFLAYFKEAWDIYTTTPKDKRKDIISYIIRAFKRGFSSLGKDIAVHDPIYTLMMYSGLKAYPQTPSWILSVLSFISAVGIVAGGEVATKEVRYHNLKRRLKRRGFKQESYLESRFYIRNGDPKKILTELSDTFNLKKRGRGEYHDRYFDTKLRSYNSRRPILRFRQRAKEGRGFMQTIQIVYTRASEMAKKHPQQFNYYPVQKDKFYFVLDQKMPWKFDDVVDERVKNFCKKVSHGNYKDVFFTRDVALDPNSILISVDKVNSINSSPFTVVELKAYPDEKRKKMFIEAMRYVMLRYEVVQTTHNKQTLTSLGTSQFLD